MLPGGWDEHKELFPFYFPPRAAKRFFLLDGYAREDSRGGITNKHTRTGQGVTAPYSVPLKALGVCVHLLELWQENF